MGVFVSAERAAISFRFLVREGLKGFAANRVVAVIVAAVCLGGSFATTLFVSTEASGIAQRWSDGVAAGRFIWTVPSKTVGGITAERCDALNSVAGVRAAGSLIRTEKVVALNSPNARYSLDSVTAGYLKILWPDPMVPANGLGLVAGNRVATTLGLQPNVSVGLRSTASPERDLSSTVSAVATRNSARDEAAAAHFYRIVPPQGVVDFCVVEAEPGATQAVQQLLLFWFPQDGDPIVRPYREGETAIGQPPELEYQERAGRWAWTIPLSLSAVLLLGIWYSRRDELSLYRLLGLRSRHLAVILGTELLVGAVLPAQIGAAAALLVSGSSNSLVREAVVATDVRLVAGLLLLPLPLLVVVRPSRVLRRLKGE